MVALSAYNIKFNSTVLLVILYLLLSSPFLFSGIIFHNFIVPYIIKIFILVCLLIRISRLGLGKNGIMLIGLGFLYTLYHIFVHPNSAGQGIVDYLDIIFSIILLRIIGKTKDRDSLIAFSCFFSFVVALLLIINTLAFILQPSLFHATEIVGYDVFYNKLLGMISVDNFRPCWYFAEPSYCGAFLAINLFMFTGMQFKHKYHRILYNAIIIVGLICCSSFGAFVAILITICILILNRIVKLKRSSLLLILFSIIYVYIVIFPNFQRESDMTYIRTNSLEARQERIKIASEVKEHMGFMDVVMGKGVNSVALQYEVGLSDAYNKLYTENGLIFMLCYLFVIYKLLKKNYAILSYFLLSLMTVIIHIFPLTLYCVIVASSLSDVQRKFGNLTPKGIL